MNPKHILLTSDLSDEALRAFPPVVDLAKAFGARITLLHVVPVVPSSFQGAGFGVPIEPADYEAERQRAERALEEQAKTLPDDMEVSIEVTVGASVPEAIADFAKDNHVGLVALSTHGRSGIRRFVLGSVAEGIVRRAEVPVLCYPPAPEGD